jgi:hypothetical protein
MTVYDARLAFLSISSRDRCPKDGGIAPPAFVEAEAMCVAAGSRPGF